MQPVPRPPSCLLRLGSVPLLLLCLHAPLAAAGAGVTGEAAPGTAAGTAANGNAAAAAASQLVASNDRLLAALQRYEGLQSSGAAAAPAAAEANLILLARERREGLEQLLERDPQRAARLLLPADLRDRFPAAARAEIERPDFRSIGSLFAVVSDDFARGVSRQHFMFQPGDEDTPLRLHVADPAVSERDLLGWSGRTVSLRGVRIGAQLLLLRRGDVQLR